MNLKTIFTLSVAALIEDAATGAPPADAKEAQARELYTSFTKALAGVPPAGFPETRRLAIVNSCHMHPNDSAFIMRNAFHGEPLIHSTGKHSCTLYVPDEEMNIPDWMTPGLATTGLVTQQSLATKFGLNQATISAIVIYKIWKHLRTNTLKR